MLRRRILLVRAAALAAAFAPLPALAHAILLASSPAPGGTLPAGPTTLEFRFNSRVDAKRSTLRLSGPGQRDETLAIAPDTQPDVLRAAADLAPGRYTAHWQVLAVDGHVTRGDVKFTVTPKP